MTDTSRIFEGSRVYATGADEVTALDSVTLSFPRGELAAIMGPSGSGKSTLMHCLAGLDRLTSGSAFLGETELNTLSDDELTLLRRDRLGFIFQAFNLVPVLSAEENILLPLRLAGADPDTEWVEKVVEVVGLADRLDHRPNELSGGQRQKVAIARSIATKPEIIFADEPTGNLDSVASDEVLDFLSTTVRELDQTLIMVSHDPYASAIADRVLFLVDGAIAHEIRQPSSDQIVDVMKELSAGVERTT